MMASAKQPSIGHNKYYFLKANIKDYKVSSLYVF